MLIWREDRLSSWYWIFACFGARSFHYLFVRYNYEGRKELQFKIIKLIDVLHEEHTMPWFQPSG